MEVLNTLREIQDKKLAEKIYVVRRPNGITATSDESCKAYLLSSVGEISRALKTRSIEAGDRVLVTRHWYDVLRHSQIDALRGLPGQAQGQGQAQACERRAVNFGKAKADCRFSQIYKYR